ncbi:MAG: metal ABC transporter permease, partial [Nitrososphaerota archaeon]|nr:metal ABC transporter permease [Nitrososphaerota archaeon]
ISRLITRKVGGMLIASFVTTILSGFCGLILSIHLNIPTSGSIALVSIILFSLAYLIRSIRTRLV